MAAIAALTDKHQLVRNALASCASCAASASEFLDIKDKPGFEFVATSEYTQIVIVTETIGPA